MNTIIAMCAFVCLMLGIGAAIRIARLLFKVMNHSFDKAESFIEGRL